MPSHELVVGTRTQPDDSCITIAKMNEGLTFVDVAVDVIAALSAAVSACVFGVTVPEEN